MQQNTNGTKYICKNAKIQTRQNTKEQNTNCQNTFVTKYKCNKIQMGQNTNRTKYKIPKYKHDKIQILCVPIENQCVQGGGLLYGGCILVFLHFVLFVFCSICILLQLYFVTFVFWQFVFCPFVFCRICILYFCILFYLYVVPFVFCWFKQYSFIHTVQ